MKFHASGIKIRVFIVINLGGVSVCVQIKWGPLSVLMFQCHPATADFFSELNKEYGKVPGGRGVLMILAAILLSVDGTKVVDKYFPASGLASAGCSLRKESSSRHTMGVFRCD